MNKISSIILLGALLSCAAKAEEYTERTGFSRSYPTDYADWTDGFLGGNGKMGIIVFGNPLNETVVYDDSTFNLAKTQDRSFAQVSAADLKTIKDECAAGDFADADKLAASSAQWKGGGSGSRHPGFEMLIAIPSDGAVSEYSRSCNFRTGEITVKWADNRGDWERKTFVSRKDNVVVQELSAPTHGAVTCTIQLDTDPGMGFPKEMAFFHSANDDFLNMRAKYTPKLDAGYEGVTRVVISGGTHTVEGNVLQVSQAKSVLMLTRTARYDDQCETQWNREDMQKQLAALPSDYSTLLAGQVATHGAIYDRVKIDLHATASERAKSNEDLLAEQKASVVPVKALWERVFDSGRYYYLCSSDATHPPALLGIWTGNCHAGFGGYYHLDANLNLQIGGGNIGDMPEAMEGYFTMNESWRTDFETNARKLLGCRGMLGGGNSPGLGEGLMASINEYYPYQYATGEEGWLLYPFWEHYQVTGDREFLRARLYPLLKEMLLFYEDFLTKTDANGKYIFAGSISPENQPSKIKISLVNNSVFDISGAKFILTTLVESAKILGVDQGPGEDAEKAKAMLNKLPPYLINSDGSLQEWAWPGLEESYGHRHSSHLLTVWPYREITPESSPALFKAALYTQSKKDENALGTGHGILHSALIAAGLKDAPSATRRLQQLLKGGWFFDSLFTSHNANQDLFCSDVSNTVPTVMMEMLISSDDGVLELMPAMPPDFPQGSISGVKGRNQVTIENLSWDLDAHTVKALLKSDIDQSITLIERDGIDGIHADAVTSASPLGTIARGVQLKAGVGTTIALDLGKLRVAPVNLALHAPISASSSTADYAATNANDGDMSTRWSSDSKDDQWLAVDLGAARKITDVKLDWEAGAAKDYDIELSDDGQAWSSIKSVTDNSKIGWLDYPDLQGQGRYVRIHGKTRLTKFGFSLWEFQVFGNW